MKIRLPFGSNPLARIALILLALLVIASVVALAIPGLDPRVAVGPRLAPPSWSVPLGTDSLGRNVFARLLDELRDAAQGQAVFAQTVRRDLDVHHVGGDVAEFDLGDARVGQQAIAQTLSQLPQRPHVDVAVQPQFENFALSRL